MTEPFVWNEKAIRELSTTNVSSIQFSDYVSEDALRALEELILRRRPNFTVRFYGFYGKTCDLSFLRLIPSVRKLRVNCIWRSANAEVIGTLEHLECLDVGLQDLNSLLFLRDVPATLQQLKIGQAKTKRINLDVLGRFKTLKSLFIEGHHNNIEIISELTNLEKVSFRSLTLPSLSFLETLKKIRSFELKLGGTTNLDSLRHLSELQYLEIWMVRGLTELSFLSKCHALQFLNLQSLRRVQELPSLAPLSGLKKISLENLKDLKTLRPLADCAVLESLNLVGNNFQPQDIEVFLGHPSLKFIGGGIWFQKKYASLRAKLEKAGICQPPHGEFYLPHLDHYF